MRHINRHIKKRGYSLVEMLVYVALLSLISLTVIETIVSIGRISSQFVIMRDLNHSGRVALEQITREIRFASNVDIGASSFNNTDGKLQFSSTDEVGDPKIIEFFIESGQIKMEDDDVSMGFITSKNVTVDELTFFHMFNTETEAVKVVLALTAQKGSIQKTMTFYNTIILRGSY